jgi:ubiquinone/menaquinone biosynthesis C-methylase UbiE
MTTKAAVGELFDGLAPEYVRSRERQPSFRAQKRIVLEMLEGIRGRVLDVGCGPAVMEAELLERGFEVAGVDVSEEMIRLGKARLAEHPLQARCHLRTGDAENLPYPHGFFDAVLAMGVLEYLPDYSAALAEMRRVLRPGGVLMLAVPSRVSPYRLLRSAFELARRRRRFVPNRCIPWLLDLQLERMGLLKLEAKGCNLGLHGVMEGVQAAPWLGTQYIVKAGKRAF